MSENLCALSTCLNSSGNVEIRTTIFGFSKITIRSFIGIVTNEPQTNIANKPTEANFEGNEEDIINDLCDYLNFISQNNQDMRILINAKDIKAFELYVKIIATKICNWRDHLYPTVIRIDDNEESDILVFKNNAMIVRFQNHNKFKDPFDIVDLTIFRLI